MSGIVQGSRSGGAKPITSIDDGGVERMAVDAKFTSGFVSEVNLDKDNDEVTTANTSDGGTTRVLTAGDSSGRTVIVGPVADGVAVAGSPVRIAGKDAGGLTQDVLTSSTGAIQVDVLTAPNPTGGATEAKQDVQITSLQLLDDAVQADNVALLKQIAVGGVMDDTSTVVATEGNVSSVRITAQRGVHANLRTVAGTEAGTAGSPLRIDPTGTTTQPVSGTVTATGPLTDAQLRATAVPVSGPLTDVQLRAAPVPVSGTVTATGPLTDAQLRASAVPVSNTALSVVGAGAEATAQRVTISNESLAALELIGIKGADGSAVAANANPVPVSDASGSLTVDAPVGTPVFARLSDGTAALTTTSGRLSVDGSGVTQPVSGPLTDAQMRATAVPVSGPLTDAQLRATAVPVSAASLPLPAGASTLAEQQTQTTSLQLADDVVHATNAALNKTTAIGGQFDDVGVTAATEDNIAAVRITAQRALHANLRNASGTEIAPLTDTQLRATAVPVSGPLTDAQLRATAVPVSNTALSVVGAGAEASAQRVTISTESLAALEATTVQNAAGASAVNVQDGGNSLTVDGTVTAISATAANLKTAATLDAETTKVIGTVNVAASQTIAVTQATAANLNAQVVGELAHDAVDSGNPIKIGGKVTAANITADITDVAAGDRVNARFDLEGRLVVAPAYRVTWANGTSVTAGTSAATLIAANANRVGLVVTHYSGTGNVFLGIATVTATAFVYMVQPGETLTIQAEGITTQLIQCIASAASQSVMVAELTQAVA